MGYRVRIPNAFTINKLGTPGGIIPFPFGLTGHEHQGIVSLSLHPFNVRDLCDLLRERVRLVLFGVTHSCYERTGEMMTLGEITATRRVDCRVLDPDTIVIWAKELVALLSDFDHDSLHAFDIPQDRIEDVAYEGVMRYYEYPWSRTETFLSALPASSFFLDSHDDCNLYMESRDDTLLQGVVERAWQMVAGTVLAEESGYQGEIATIPPAILEALFPRAGGLTVFRDETRVENLHLQVGVSPISFSFQENREYPLGFHVTYDAGAGVWNILS